MLIFVHNFKLYIKIFSCLDDLVVVYLWGGLNGWSTFQIYDVALTLKELTLGT